MKNKPNRRSFLKNLSAGGAAAVFFPVDILTSPGEKKDIANESSDKADDKGQNQRAYNAPYTGEHLNRLAFPIGGLGAGMFCMEGTGAISHMSVRNRPEIFHTPGVFAAICIKGTKNGAKLLEGPVPDWKKFGLQDSANGQEGSTIGLPHFHHASFKTKFPFGHLDLSDNDLPLQVQVTGWSPFIPTDDDNSSLPVGAIEYKFTNKSNTSIDAVFSFNSKNFLAIDKGINSIYFIHAKRFCVV